MRVINVTLARLAKRANAAIRLSGIRAAAGRVMPSSRTDFSRSIPARTAGPLTRVGPERSLSSQEPRLPPGTVSKYSSRLRCSLVMPRPNKRHTLIYPAAQADDEPFERTATGQQNFVRQQPGGSTLE